MAALTKDRNTLARSKGPLVRYKVAGATKIYNGALVAVNSAGYLVPASDTAGLICVGRAAEQVDNSSGAAGDKSCDVEFGVFKWLNSGTNACEQDDIGRVVYAEDDQTVGDVAGATPRPKAGMCLEIESDGVWVATFPNTVSL